jgi:predicted Zn-dependent peptidase
MVDVPLDFIPSAPKNKVNGRIVAVRDGVTMIGQYQVVVINRGARDGLAPGNVLAVFDTGDTARDNKQTGFVHFTSDLFNKNVRLPGERNGTFMVFKVFDRISYGLIMEATDIIRVADRVQSP